MLLVLFSSTETNCSKPRNIITWEVLNDSHTYPETLNLAQEQYALNGADSYVLNLVKISLQYRLKYAFHFRLCLPSTAPSNVRFPSQRPNSKLQHIVQNFLCSRQLAAYCVWFCTFYHHCEVKINRHPYKLYTKRQFLPHRQHRPCSLERKIDSSCLHTQLLLIARNNI